MTEKSKCNTGKKLSLLRRQKFLSRWDVSRMTGVGAFKIMLMENNIIAPPTMYLKMFAETIAKNGLSNDSTSTKTSDTAVPTPYNGITTLDLIEVLNTICRLSDNDVSVLKIKVDELKMMREAERHKNTRSVNALSNDGFWNFEWGDDGFGNSGDDPFEL